LGTLFGDAVKETMSALLFVGGTIIMFSVLIRMLAVAGVTGRLTAALAPLAAARGVDVSLIEAVVKGLVEITNGAQAAAAANAPLTQRAVAAAGIIAWSGPAVHAQVAAMVRGTNIRVVPYIAARALHGALAAAFAGVLVGPAPGVINVGAVPALHPACAAQARRVPATPLGLAMLVPVAAGAAARRVAAFWARVRCRPLRPGGGARAAASLQLAAALLHGAERPFERLLEAAQHAVGVIVRAFLQLPG